MICQRPNGIYCILTNHTALDNGDNILLSTIGANAEKFLKQIKAYKDDGYQVYLHLNELPNAKSLARAIGRYISEDGKLGRYVSTKLIAGSGDKPTQTYLYLTGQGGNDHGKLDGNLRTGGRPAPGDAAQTGGAPGSTEVSAVPTDLLAGYDWYNNDVERGQPPRLIQSSEQHGESGAAKGKAGNGSYSGAEVKAAIDSMRGLSTKEKSVLWQLATGSKSTKNNPYDKQWGQKVIDARNKE